MTHASGKSALTRTMFALLMLGCVGLIGTACAPSAGQGRRPAPTGPALRDIVFPVGMEVAFRDTFGAPRGGGTRSHAGQDLMAPKMTPLVATTDGVVAWLRWSNAGNAGNMLVLRDSDGWEYWYIHINNDTPGTDDSKNRYDQAFSDGMRDGQRVKAGEVIGYVGDSGNAEGTSSHLHFEMHDPAGNPVNSFNTLARARLQVRTDAQTAADRPVGNLESIRRTGTSVTLTGWGLDARSNDSIKATALVNGNPVTTASAAVTRPDVESTHPGRGAKHGFELTSVTAPSGSTVCVVLHSVGGGGNTRLPCRTAP